MYFRTAVFILFLSSFGLGQNGLEIKGSSTMYPLINKLAQLYSQGKDFQINVEQSSSSKGVAHAASGGGVGLCSRGLKKSEQVDGITAVHIASDGIMLLVSPTNQIKSLTLLQANEIFSGKVSNWAEVGGADSAITCYGPNEKHGTHGAFLDILKIGSCPESTTLFDSQEEILNELMNDSNGVGWVSVGSVLQYSKNNSSFNLRPLAIEGVKPTLASIKQGKYPLVRPLLLVLSGEPEGLAQDFISFAKSKQGNTLITSFGFIP